MGQFLHGCARTTEAVRLAIQGSEERVRALAARYGVSPTTIQKWRNRDHVHDAAMGPKQVRSLTLTLEQEAAWWPSAGTRCCRSTTACMPCSRSYPI